MVDVKYGNFKVKKVYEAKIVKIDTTTKKILVHYLGWNNRSVNWTTASCGLKRVSYCVCVQGTTNGSKSIAFAGSIAMIRAMEKENE